MGIGVEFPGLMGASGEAKSVVETLHRCGQDPTNQTCLDSQPFSSSGGEIAANAMGQELTYRFQAFNVPYDF